MNYDYYITQQQQQQQRSSLSTTLNNSSKSTPSIFTNTNTNTNASTTSRINKNTTTTTTTTTTSTTYRIIDSILKLLFPSSTSSSGSSTSSSNISSMSASTLSSPLKYKSASTFQNNNKQQQHQKSSNKKLQFNKLFSRSYVKNTTTHSRNTRQQQRKSTSSSVHTTTSSNCTTTATPYRYGGGVYNLGNSCLATSNEAIYMDTSTTKSIYSSLSSSKDLSWYKMEELDPYYQVLEHVMEETSANIFNVIETLQEKFIILTGGCAKDNSILFTFTDNSNTNTINTQITTTHHNHNDRELLKFENYCRIIDYLCNIPSEIDKRNGFTLLIDRRNDKWSSIKNILLYIQEYFPSKINNIYILRPQSYLQRVLSTLFFQEDSLINSINLNPNRTFNLKICKTLDDLYELVDKKQLTTEFGGCIHYRHQEWIEQRQFIEKLSSTVNEAVSSIKEFIKSMEETDFPNDVIATELLINNQLTERSELLANVLSTRRFGETVLNVIEKTSKIDKYKDKMDKYSALTPDIRIHYQTVYNLIRYLDESEETLDSFWKNHYIRLNKCLDLRKFEQSFKDIRISLLSIFDNLNRINEELCVTMNDYEQYIEQLEKLKQESQGVLKQAIQIYEQGTRLLNENQNDNAEQQQQQQQQQQECNIEISLDHNNGEAAAAAATADVSLPKLTRNKSEIINENNKSGYCIDSVEPKCYELKRYVNEFTQNYELKLESILRNKSAYEQIQILKDYYLKGMDLFNEQQILNMNADKAKKYLNDINTWQSNLLDLNNTSGGGSDEYKSSCSIFKSLAVLFEQQQQQQLEDDISLLNINTNLKLGMQEIYNQLKALVLMFNKRCEQLKKIAFPSVHKPVQRVEPQQLANDNEKTNSSSTSSGSSSTTTGSNNINKANTFPNLNLVKRNNTTNGSLNYERMNSTSKFANEQIAADELVLDEEQIKSYEKKQKHVLNELVETEKLYINELKLIIEGYLLKLYDQNNFPLISASILANREILFGNIREIYEFHSKYFLKDLERAQYSVDDVSRLFMQYRDNFYLYSMYCQNKPLSEEVWQEYGINCQFFKTLQMNLGHRLPLDAYLLKPVQRISKYQLLLKELLKYSVVNSSGNSMQLIEQALTTMVDIVNNLNDVMHSSFIFGFNELKQQGKLLKRDQLVMTKYKRNSKNSINVVNRLKLNNDTNKIIELFLYEQSLIICKRKSDDALPSLLLPLNNSASLTSSTATNSSFSSQSSSTTTTSSSSSSTSSSSVPQFYYQFKEAIKTNEIGLTENIKGDKKKFEIWTDNYSYTFEANNEQEKQQWTMKIKNLLESQLNEMKLKNQIRKDILPTIENLKISNSAKNVEIITSLQQQRRESDEDSIENMNSNKHRLSNSSSSSSSGSNSTTTLHIESENGRIISF